jgi:3-hydroxyisobutyrate dehydrogenase-like beta-hydroxyacid dehydrogenase
MQKTATSDSGNHAVSTGTTIGVIGLGNMGSRLAANLLKEKFSVAAYDVKRENIEQLAARKLGDLAISNSNAELARVSDIVFSVLPTSESARAAILDEKNGLIAGLNRRKTLVEMSSIDSKTINEVSKKLNISHECDVVDATINGVEENVERREIVVMTAGDRKVIDERVKPVLERVVRAVVYVDDRLGSAKDLKTATAMANAIETMGISEVLAWLAKRNVNTGALLEVMEHSATNLNGMTETTKKLLQGNFKPRASWISKDIGFGLKEAEDSGAPMPITAAVQQLFLTAKARDLAGWEATGIARKVYETIANVKFNENI